MASASRETPSEFSSNIPLEKQVYPGAHDAFLLLHENLIANSRSNVSFSLQAGYAKIWDEKSMLQKISADHQEVGCAYVRANFSF